MALQADSWNSRYASTDYAYGLEPNDFLVECVHQPFFPSPSTNPRILCLADGEGRNSVYLASLGYTHVTAVDFSPVGLAKARALAEEKKVAVAPVTVEADLEVYEPPADGVDVIVSIFCHMPSVARRAMHARMVKALSAPNGLYLFEAYSPEQVKFGTGGPKDEDLLMTVDKVREELVDAGVEEVFKLETLERTVMEGRLHTGQASVTQFVGRMKQKK